MKKILYILLFFIAVSSFILRSPVYAGTNIENDIGPIPCFGGACPPDLPTVYGNTPSNPLRPEDAYIGESCKSTYEEFLADPARFHFWAEDIEVTNQGKADERARQFIYWVINKPSLDNNATLKGIWNSTRNISYFLVIIVAVVIGIGFIISQRTNFNLKIKIWPAIWKILLALIYITLSASIILFLIQISEFLMRFFIDTLGGKDLFNIYFSSSTSSESNYTNFYGCRDLNIRSQEAADTEMLMLKFTNITYYVMGSMLLLRKLLLWFLLFVSPFLAILMPFVFIRNTGWIWIGVFFQWLFYGPLFALFLGALSSIWKAGIPFQFDFSRTNTAAGYIYPTAIRILYGGPAQRLSILNNANYIDTYVEYIITLLMLWAVTFFPWWLLRIFRDYCCDVFAAANNVLLSMYDQMRTGPIAPPPTSQLPKSPPRSTTGLAREIPRGEGRTSLEQPVSIRVQSMSEIKQAKTQDILSSLNLYAPRLTDIAKFETNKQSQTAMQKNLSFIANPVKAETPTERQQYMNIRTELFSRASKDDKLARGIISSTSTSFVEKEQSRAEILKNTPQAIPMSQVVSSSTQMSQEKVQSITNNIINSVVNNNSALSNIAQSSNVSQEQVKSILNSYSQNLAQPTNQVMNNIAQATNTSKEQVSEVIKQAMNVSEQSNVVSQIATQEKISNETVQKILQTLPMAVAQQQQQNQSMTQNISVTANIPQEKAQSITTNIFNNVANNTKITNALAQSSNLSQQQVKSVLNTMSQNMNMPMSQAINTTSQQTNVSKEKIAEVLQKSNLVMQQSSIVKETAENQKTDAKTVEKVVQAVKESVSSQTTSTVPASVTAQQKQNITSSIFNTVINNATTMQTLEKETNIPAAQLKNVLSTYSQNINQTPEVITDRIAQSAGIEKQKVAPALKKILSSVGKDSVVNASTLSDIAKKENVKVADIKKVVASQVPLVTEADKHIEKSIAIPSTISLEDYEEVKKMWTSQYEKGEVPTQENIASREQWVDQDTVTITNTLNKLMSEDEALRREGLDDLGYILPIFMINNLKGDEMMVYLKAKLEAAKSVKSQMVKVKEVVQVEQPEEEFVDVDRAQAQAAPEVLHMEVEEEIQQTQPEVQVAETDGFESRSYSAPTIRVTRTQPAFVLKVEEIKNIKTNDLVRNMNMFAEKLTDIAKFDTNRETRETVTKHIEYLANPEKATSANERQTYIDIRSELSTRGAQDHVAQQLISPSKEHILQSVPQAIPAVNVVSNMVNLPQTKVQSITSSLVQSVSQNNSMVNSIAQNTQLPQTSVQTVFNSFTQNMNQPTNQIINSISQQTNIPKEKVTQILQQMSSVVSQSSITQSISDKEQVSSATILNVMQALTSPVREIPTQPISTQLAQSTNVPVQTVNLIAQSTVSFIANNPSRVQYIESQTGLNEKQTQTALTVLTQNLDKPIPVILNQISQQTGITVNKAGDIMQTLGKMVESKKTLESIASTSKSHEKDVLSVVQSLSTYSKESVEGSQTMVQTVAQQANIPEKQAQSIISSVISNATTNESLMHNIETQTGMNTSQVKNVLTSYAKNVNQPSNVLVDRIAQSTGIEKTKIAPALQTAMKSINTDIASSKDIIKKIATKEGVTENQATKVLGTHVPMVTKAEENVEMSVPIPAGVSIEDYEEVKKMWSEQYEKGEVPTVDNITSREQWIDQDTVMLTNVLNKLLSPDETLRRQALDDVGVLLPIFMVNNLTGEELLVYLKAKLEAAKSIKAELVKSQTAVEQPEEEFIDVKRDGGDTTTQTLHMEVEEPVEKKINTVQIDTSAPVSDEGEESALHDTLASMKHGSTTTTTPFTMSTDEIKNVKTNDLVRNLNMAVSKLTDIARLDTNRMAREAVSKHIAYLADPTKAVSPAEQQTYKEIRNELTNRSSQDATAKQLISSTQDHMLKDFPKAAPMTDAISSFVKLSSEKIQSITAAVLNAVAQNKNILNMMNQNIQVPQDTIQNTLITFTHSMYIPSNLVVDTIGQQLDLPNETVSRILQEVNGDVQQATILDLKDIIKKTAEVEKITEDIVKQVIAAQIQIIIAPETYIENTIPLSPNVSIEDYEEVKNMWAEQYENGEIPVGGKIDTRESWITQDIILITNILNKLLSSDDKLRLEAMNDIGFLLPIFILNNLTGQELLMYLKAKLEAAKLVLKQLKKETDLKDKLKQISTNETEEVIVTKKKKEVADTNKKEMKVEEEPGKNSRS